VTRREEQWLGPSSCVLYYYNHLASTSKKGAVCSIETFVILYQVTTRQQYQYSSRRKALCNKYWVQNPTSLGTHPVVKKMAGVASISCEPEERFGSRKRLWELCLGYGAQSSSVLPSQGLRSTAAPSAHNCSYVTCVS